MDKLTTQDNLEIGKVHLGLAKEKSVAAAGTFLHARIACQKLYAAKVMGADVGDLLEQAEDRLDACCGAQIEAAVDAELEGFRV